MDFNKFRKVLQTSEISLQAFCAKELKNAGYTEMQSEPTFLYAKGDIPILLVAHMDTVHKKLPFEIYYDKKEKVMWSPTGIGGDDRCGVFLILEIIKRFKPFVLFTQMEESGGWGAKDFSEYVQLDLVQCDVNFMLEIDRRNSNDAVFYDCGNKEFQEYILSFGWDLNYGTFSDICILSDAMDIASVNVSAGYEREHTFTETIHLDWMEETLFKVCSVLATPSVKYDHQFSFKNSLPTSCLVWRYPEDARDPAAWKNLLSEGNIEDEDEDILKR